MKLVLVALPLICYAVTTAQAYCEDVEYQAGSDSGSDENFEFDSNCNNNGGVSETEESNYFGIPFTITFPDFFWYYY